MFAGLPIQVMLNFPRLLALWDFSGLIFCHLEYMEPTTAPDSNAQAKLSLTRSQYKDKYTCGYSRGQLGAATETSIVLVLM